MSLATLEKLAIDTIGANNVVFDAEDGHPTYGTYTVLGPNDERLMTVEHGSFCNIFSGVRQKTLGVVTIAPDNPEFQLILDSASNTDFHGIVTNILMACRNRAMTTNPLTKAMMFLKNSRRQLPR